MQSSKQPWMNVPDTYPIEGLGGVREIPGKSKSFFSGGYASAGAVGAVPFGTPPMHLPISGRCFLDKPLPAAETAPVDVGAPTAGGSAAAGEEPSPTSPTTLQQAAEQADAAAKPRGLSPACMPTPAGHLA